MREGIVEFVTIGLTRERILIDLEKCKHLELKAKDETREAAEKRETYYKNNHKKIYDKVVQLRNELKGQTTIIG
ncbi:MAG TPA: hypothetical protein VEA58_04085 [Anaerovoracaceae bacterium]|nr:hypothetical protein [Anaerovoracaceae bacterium]